MNSICHMSIFIHVASENVCAMPKSIYNMGNCICHMLTFIYVMCKFMCDMRYLIRCMYSFICNVSWSIYDILVLYWASKNENEPSHWNFPKFGYEPGRVKKGAWNGFTLRLDRLMSCTVLVLHLGNCFHVYTEFLSYCYWIIMIFNNICYLDFNGFWNTNIKQENWFHVKIWAKQLL